MTEEQLRLFEENKYIVHKIVKKYWNCDKEDLISQGYLILLNCIKRFNKDFNVKPKTYFYSILNRKLYSKLKKQRKNTFECDSTDAFKFYNIVEENNNWEEFVDSDLYDEFELEERIDNNKLLTQIIADTNLTERERKIIDLLLNGLCIKQISEELNVSEQYCRNRYCTLLKKLKKEGEKYV